MDWLGRRGLMGDRIAEFGIITRIPMKYYLGLECLQLKHTIWPTSTVCGYPNLGQTTNQLTCSEIGFNCDQILKVIKEFYMI